MKIENGCTYKFSCVAASLDGIPVPCKEVFTEDGVAHHDDCGYNIVSKV